MKHPPLTRHESLQPLSRDHYAGLVQSRRLAKAADGSDRIRRSAIAEFLHAWNTELEAHLHDEERLLLPLLEDSQQMTRLLDEHARLCGFASDAARFLQTERAPAPRWMRTLSDLLRDHIRWEERELFPLIQQTTPANRLADLAQQTARIENVRPRWRDRKRPDWVDASAS